MKSRKRTKTNTESKAVIDILCRFLSLLLGFVSYSINARPRLGFYEQGFLDCSLISMALLILWFSFPKKKK